MGIMYHSLEVFMPSDPASLSQSVAMSLQMMIHLCYANYDQFIGYQLSRSHNPEQNAVSSNYFQITRIHAAHVRIIQFNSTVVHFDSINVSARADMAAYNSE